MSPARASTAAWIAALCVGVCACATTPEPEQAVEEPGSETPANEEPEVEAEAETDPGDSAEVEGAEQEDVGSELDAVTKQALAETIRGYLPELQVCYEDELAKNSSLKGKMTCTITIERTGAVRKVSIDVDTVGNQAVRACAVAKIEAWRFAADRLEEPADVTFAVKFESV